LVLPQITCVTGPANNPSLLTMSSYLDPHPSRPLLREELSSLYEPDHVFWA
jgi:hypothetical protein